MCDPCQYPWPPNNYIKKRTCSLIGFAMTENSRSCHITKKVIENEGDGDTKRYCHTSNGP